MPLQNRAWLVMGLLLMAGAADGQIVQRNATYWLPADYNNVFYDTHTAAAQSFYAAHYAHFGVYEVALSDEDLDFAMVGVETRVRELIAEPPRFEPPFEILAPTWAQMAYPTGSAMDWTHHLHEQLYDILTDDRIPDRRVAGERAISHYLTNERSAFATRGYGHAFMMGGGSWAGTFADRFPGVNGILWAYHWHHAAVYEALMEPTQEARTTELARVLTVFEDSVLASPPTYMPLTAQVAPRFSALFPAAAQIFDNLHMMHDVVNDIMVDDRIPTGAKAAEIDRMLAQQLYRNQDWVIPPEVPAEAHMNMPMEVMTVPTQMPDGTWLPQGHPDADLPEGMGGHGDHNMGNAR